MQIPWLFPIFIFSQTFNKIPWLFPDFCQIWNFPDFSLTVGHPEHHWNGVLKMYRCSGIFRYHTQLIQYHFNSFNSCNAEPQPHQRKKPKQLMYVFTLHAMQMGINVHSFTDVRCWFTTQMNTTKMLKLVEVNCGHARNFAERRAVYISWISRNTGS